MEIKINGQPTDITIENEKTVGEVLAGMDMWLTGSGHRMNSLAIDGQIAGVDSLEEAISKEIDTIKVLEITTTSIAQLTVTSLSKLLDDIDEYQSLDFEQRKDYLESWKQKPQAQFALEQMPDIYAAYESYFSNTGLPSMALRAIAEERIRETESPVSEFVNLHPQLDETCKRLVDLPLDIQTGKDSRAAMTIQLFSGVAEKIIRLYKQFNLQLYLPPDKIISTETIPNLIGDFNNAAGELLQAYETNDTILIGDLAEYEMAPRLTELYNVINDNINEQEEIEKK